MCQVHVLIMAFYQYYLLLNLAFVNCLSYSMLSGDVVLNTSFDSLCLGKSPWILGIQKQKQTRHLQPERRLQRIHVCIRGH